MIREIRANDSRFKPISFTSGLNIILSDTTDKSSKKESRNGTGKTALIDLIHYCLGSKKESCARVYRKELQDWQFFIDFEYLDSKFTVSRENKDPTKILLSGSPAFIKRLPPTSTGKAPLSLRITDACEIYGDLFFGLPKKESKYTPTFRSLISFFVRRFNQDGTTFADPFKHCAEQGEWDKQVNNAYLLDLNWEDAKKFQLLKDREKSLDTIRKVVENGMVPELSEDTLNVARLEAEKFTIETRVSEIKKRIDSFRVHENYREIELKANDLTRQIHEFSNKNFALRQSLSLYKSALEAEKAPDVEYIESLYKEAQVAIPELIKAKLEAVRKFHSDLLQNRREFLSTEIKTIEDSILKNEAQIKRLSDERAQNLEVLRTHGALTEFNALNHDYVDLVTRSKLISERIDESKKFLQGKRVVKIEKAQLQSKATINFDNFLEVRQEEINLFNEYSTKLYDSPGHLLVSISESGFNFDIDIKRGSSQGFGYMKILCYDLVLATLWSKKKYSPKFLIHDSTIFDGVDSRQIAHSIQLAAELSEKYGFQYICCMNSDILPIQEFSKGFDVNKYVRCRLDDTETGGLFGFRF